MSIDELLNLANSFEAAVHAVIGARSRGAVVSTDSLVKWLELSKDQRLWSDFIQIDPAHAHIVLDRYPELIKELARPLMQVVPERTIPHLFRLAVGDARELNSAADHPLRLIQDWVESSPQRTGEAVERRKTLWSCIKEWFAKNGDTSVGAHAIASALSPDYDQSEMVAGKRMFRFRRGTVNAKDLVAIAELWPDVFNTLQQGEFNEWRTLFAAIDQWVYRRHPSLSLPDTIKSIRKATAIRMVTDLHSLAGSRPGVQKELQRRCAVVGATLQFQIDQEYAVLFPEEDFGDDWKRRRNEDAERVRALAAKWKGDNPRDVCTRLVRFVNESKATGRAHPDYSEYCCALIAADVDDASVWLSALLEAGGESCHVLPFVERILKDRPNGWRELTRSCLSDSRWQYAAVCSVLKCDDIDPELLNEVYEVSKGFPGLIEILCMNGKLADERIKVFLENPDSALAEASSKGLWHCEPHGTIPEDLKSRWRQAVISSVTDEYDLCEMMRSDKELAYEWLADRAVNNCESYYRQKKAYAVANEQCTDGERRELLGKLNPENYCAFEFVAALVGNSPEMYKVVLSNRNLKRQQLAPLRARPTGEWCDLACVALNAGCAPSEIARAAYQGRDAVSWGPISSRHESQLEEWIQLNQHSDSRIREVGRIGEEESRQHIKMWKEMEKADEIEDYFD